MTDVTQPVHAFGWKASPLDRHTLAVGGASLAFLAASLAIVVFEGNDGRLIAFAWLVLVIAALALVEIVWPYLTIRGPVVEITPDSVLDRRILKDPVRWRDISDVYGGIGPDVEMKVRPSRSSRVKKRRLREIWAVYGLGLGSFTIVEAPIETQGQSLHALCRDYHKAAKRARAAAAVPALERAAREGLQGAALDKFIDAIRDVPLLIPIFEQHHAQTLDVAEEAGGTRAMHVFTDNPRYYTMTPQDYYLPMFPDALLDAAPVYRLDAIVINPGVGPELRIERERFAEIAERLRAG